MKRLENLASQLQLQPVPAQDRTALCAQAEARRAAQHRAEVLAYVGPHAYSSTQHALDHPQDPTHTTSREDFTAPEVAVAKRCHGTHLEVLSRDTTPVGSHYLLIHYDVPHLDAATHRVQVHGLVSKPLSLSVEDLRRRPAFTERVVLECAGNGRMGLKKRFWTHMPWGQEAVGCGVWTGCRLSDVLQEAGVQYGAKQVIFTGADKGVQDNEVQYFQRSLTVDEAMMDSCMLAYEMNGAELAPCHGFPMRLLVPGWYGMASVKWLTSIKVTAGGWTGHQMKVYSYARHDEDPNYIPMRMMFPRALMAPPGFPDFLTRTRVTAPGLVRVRGRAWSGGDDVVGVEFTSDGGRTWAPAALGRKNGPFGWCGWSFDWRAEPGTAVLAVRATNAHGLTQDEASDEQFNAYSMGCTQPQMVYVRVVASDQAGDYVDLKPEARAAKRQAQPLTAATLSAEHVDALNRALSQ